MNKTFVISSQNNIFIYICEERNQKKVKGDSLKIFPGTVVSMQCGSMYLTGLVHKP